MPKAVSGQASAGVERLHLGALCIAASALFCGLLASRPLWVAAGVSALLLLPVLRLATTVVAEARERRFVNALMGLVVLAFLLLSRRIS